MGKKKKSTTVVNNPSYNDKWIKNRFASDQAAANKSISDAAASRQAGFANSKLARKDIINTQNQLRSDATNWRDSAGRDRDKLWQSLGDLSRKEVQWGDVKGLEKQLSGIIGKSQSADDVLKGLIKEQGDQMGYNLKALQQGLSGQFDLGMGNLEKSMGEKYTQTQSDIAGLGEKFQSDLTSKYADLGSRLGKGLSGLESTFTKDIGNVRTALGQGLTELTGKNVELGKDLSGVKTAFGDWRKQTGDKFRDVDTTFKAYKDDLSKEGRRTDAAISDVYKTREKTVSDLNSAWGKQLQEQESVLTGRTAEVKAEMNKRLSDIATTMNYRTLGDSALGIRSRRSKAHTSGAASIGTGQLGRGAIVKTLNIA
jgi:hypothetical protein